MHGVQPSRSNPSSRAIARAIARHRPASAARHPGRERRAHRRARPGRRRARGSPRGIVPEQPGHRPSHEEVTTTALRGIPCQPAAPARALAPVPHGQHGPHAARAVTRQRAPQPVAARRQPRVELHSPSGRVSAIPIDRPAADRPMRAIRRSCGSSPRFRNWMIAAPRAMLRLERTRGAPFVRRHHQPPAAHVRPFRRPASDLQPRRSPPTRTGVHHREQRGASARRRVCAQGAGWPAEAAGLGDHGPASWPSHCSSSAQ